MHTKKLTTARENYTWLMVHNDLHKNPKTPQKKITNKPQMCIMILQQRKMTPQKGQTNDSLLQNDP